MFCFLRLCFGTLVRLLRSRHSLLLENLALRHQLVVLKSRHPRPKLDLSDKLFWLLVRRCWSGWMARTRLRMMLTFPSLPLKVGSRLAPVSRRFRLLGLPVSSGSGLTSRTVNRFPDPAASNRACPFRALGFPVGFASRVMRPIVPEQLSS